MTVNAGFRGGWQDFTPNKNEGPIGNLLLNIECEDLVVGQQKESEVLLGLVRGILSKWSDDTLGWYFCEEEGHSSEEPEDLPSRATGWQTLLDTSPVYATGHAWSYHGIDMCWPNGEEGCGYLALSFYGCHQAAALTEYVRLPPTRPSPAPQGYPR